MAPDIISPEKHPVGSNIRFSIASVDITVHLESFANRHQWPPVLASFTSPARDPGSAALFFKWIADEGFCEKKKSEPFYLAQRKKWLKDPNAGSEQIYHHIANETWTVFFSPVRQMALGIGPKRYFFDIFSGALELAYIQLSLTNKFFLLHSAAIIISGRCFLFPGVSGAGKTTLSQNASKYGHEVLSDDRVLIMHDDINGYFAHGTPFGQMGLNKGGYPIAGVFILEQSDQNRIKRVSNIEVFEDVWFIEYQRRRRFFGGAAGSDFFARFMDFLDCHPTFRLKFKKNFDDWDCVAARVAKSLNNRGNKV